MLDESGVQNFPRELMIVTGFIGKYDTCLVQLFWMALPLLVMVG